MEADDAVDDGEAEAGAAFGAGDVFAGERFYEIGGSAALDTGAVVAYGDDGGVVGAAGFDTNVVFAVAHGVIDQVVQDGSDGVFQECESGHGILR